jgi:DNA-directed RNA polymerase III subunit RPC3
VDRFGNLSARILEMLQRKKYLEQQSIADLAIIPAREARERLYKLFK